MKVDGKGEALRVSVFVLFFGAASERRRGAVLKHRARRRHLTHVVRVSSPEGRSLLAHPLVSVLRHD